MLSINNNASAQSILSNLNNVQNQMSTSYQQLSTGNQVNSAADNPASYAISQQMTSQINGLNQATQNAQNGISMIQTATGAQNQIEQVLQTMSTLATEASNSGNTFSDRANLQLEMNALAQQINATTNQTQYNGIGLLTGQFGSGNSNLTLQIGANQGQTMSFNIEATDAATLGVAGGQATGVSNYTASTGTAPSGSGITANSSASDIATGGAISFSNSSLIQSGMNLQIAMSATLSAATGTVAQAVSNAVTQAVDSSSGAAAVASQMVADYNTAAGATYGTISNASTVTGTITTALQNFYKSGFSNSSGASSDAVYTLYNSIMNAFGSATFSGGSTGGFTATALNAALGDIFNAAGASYSGAQPSTSNSYTSSNLAGLKLNNSTTSGVVGGGAQTANSSLVTYLANQINTQLNTNDTSNGTTYAQQLVSPSGAQFTGQNDAILNFYTGSDSQLTEANVSLQLEDSSGSAIGSAVQVTNMTNNPITLGDTATGATLSLTLNSPLSNFFTIASGSAVSGTYTQTNSFTTTGSTPYSGNAGTGWQAQSDISGINIMSQSSAQNAITAIQGAINNLSSSQAKLGAVQDRLNYTVSNLGNSAQNLQNAQSTITNTDMAAAYTQFSQQQVLQQVGISMLSQAQQQPQMILKLLQ